MRRGTLQIALLLAVSATFYAACDNSKPKQKNGSGTSNASGTPAANPCANNAAANGQPSAYPTSTPAGERTFTLADTPVPGVTSTPAALSTPTAYTNTNTTAGAAPCTGNVSGTNSTLGGGDIGFPPGDPAAALNDGNKAACDTAKKMFNRPASACYEYALDMSWCTNIDSVANKFQELAGLGQALRDKMNGTYAGYTLDQCGTEGSKPILTVYKIDSAAGKLLTGIIKP